MENKMISDNKPVIHGPGSDPCSSHTSCSPRSSTGGCMPSSPSSATRLRGFPSISCKPCPCPRFGSPDTSTYDGSSGSLDLFLLRNRKTRAPRKARTARPPTTPPAMAPAGVLCDVLEEDGCVEPAGVEVGSVEPDWEEDDELVADEFLAG